VIVIVLRGAVIRRARYVKGTRNGSECNGLCRERQPLVLSARLGEMILLTSIIAKPRHMNTMMAVCLCE
jgi:hypothetical protein